MADSETVTIEDDDEEVVLVGVNTGIVDLTSDISSDEDCRPPVTVVPKPKVPERKKSRIEKKIKHTLINIENIVVPFIFRGQQQLVEKNLVEELLFFKYFQIFSDELIQCMTPVLFMLTDEEKVYFEDLHKQFNCSGAISTILFVKEDVEKMLEFLKNCYDMLVINKPKFNICGFVKVLGTLIPFIMHNWFKFMPLFYFENDSELGKKLSKLSATFSNPWVLSYLKVCCKLEGVRERFYLNPQIQLVNLTSLVKHLPDGTRVDIFWPDKINDILFRSDYLKNKPKVQKSVPYNIRSSDSNKRQTVEETTKRAKKSKSKSTNEQNIVEKSNKFNDIKVTIENVMTVSDDSDDQETEFDESNKNNQNVIVIRANDSVPIQMSLNVGPVNSSQSSANLDQILASHNQMLFNPNLHNDSESNVKKSPIILNSHMLPSAEHNSFKIENKYTSTQKYKILPKISSDKSETVPCTTTQLTSTSYKTCVAGVEKPEIKNLQPTSVVQKITQKTVASLQSNLNMSNINNFQSTSSAQETLDTSSCNKTDPLFLDKSTNISLHCTSSAQEMLDVSRRILNLAEPDFRIKTEIKTEEAVEITMEDIQGETDDASSESTESMGSIRSSKTNKIVDFDEAIVPVSMIAVKPAEENFKEMEITPVIQASTASDLLQSSDAHKAHSRSKSKLKSAVFSSPISAINTQAEPYPVMQAVELAYRPVEVEPPASSEIVMPRIVNAFSVKDVVEETPSPSFVRVEGPGSNTPPPVMIINKENTQSILFRVTQLEDESSTFIDSRYLIRQVPFNGKKFNCINLNPGKFSQWLISITEIENKLFFPETTTQELIKTFFNAGLELFRLSNNQKTTFQLFKDPSLITYINGIYVNLDDFKEVYEGIQVTAASQNL